MSTPDETAEETQPWYQTLLKWAIPIGGAFFGLADALDLLFGAFTNITPTVSWIGLGIIMFAWPILELLFKYRRIKWKFGTGPLSIITKLPVIRSACIGFILLFFLPRIIELVPPLDFERPGETLIVVVPFFHPEGVSDHDEAQQIKQAIDEQIQARTILNTRVVVAEGKQIRAEDRAAAEALGKRYWASMIIWGSNIEVEVEVNYLNLRQPYGNAGNVQILETGEQGRTQIANPKAYAGFITDDLPKSMTFLSLFAIGQAAFVRKDYAGATNIIQAAIENLKEVEPLPSGAADAYFRLGWLYQMYKGDDKTSIGMYTQAIASDPKYPNAYNNRGIAYAHLGLYAKAVDDFTQEIRINPKDAKAYINRGLAHQESWDFKKAIDDYTQAIATDPKSFTAYTYRGAVYDLSGEYAKALDDHTQAIVIDPNYAIAYYHRGLAHHKVGEYSKAIDDYTQAIALNPKLAIAYYDRGLIYQLHNETDKAIADFQMARELSTNRQD